MSTPKHVEHLPGGGTVHYARCWSCMCQQCPGGPHDWADSEDLAHAEATGPPSPVGQSCACSCVDDPESRYIDPEPDIDEMALRAEPCAVCGETGACGFDSEGRPLIHADGWNEDDEGDEG